MTTRFKSDHFYSSRAGLYGTLALCLALFAIKIGDALGERDKDLLKHIGNIAARQSGATNPVADDRAIHGHHLTPGLTVILIPAQRKCV